MSLNKFAKLSVAMTLLLGSAASMAATQETIVFLRHGEKPAGGLGQLTCQGLNRALHLPAVLAAKYSSTPYAIYAPDPSTKVSDPAGQFYYVRPLATIEPSAIQFGSPLNTPYGFTNISDMEKLLIKTDPGTSTSVVYVAWEHVQLEAMVKGIINTLGGDSGVVPKWHDSDYDSLYVLTLQRDGSTITPTFTLDHENLNGMSQTCPQ